MATLKEILGGQAQQTPQTGEGQKLQDILRTKETGKATSSSGPRASSLGEAAAVDTYKQQQQQLVNQVNINQQQLEQQKTEQQRVVDEQNAGLVNKAATMQDQFSKQFDSILKESNQQNRQLDFKSDAHTLEMLGANARLQSDKYVTMLQLEGNAKRMDQKDKFELEMARTVFKDNLDILQKKMDASIVYTDKENDFENQLANIDIFSAVDMAKIAIKEANTQSVASGAGGIVSGSAQGYAAYEDKQKKSEEA
jgi:hypothetical protein